MTVTSLNAFCIKDVPSYSILSLNLQYDVERKKVCPPIMSEARCCESLNVKLDVIPTQVDPYNR